MKKTIFIICLMIFSLSATTALAAENVKKNSIPEKTENKLSEEELSRLTKRIESIRDMDKSDLTAKERRELKKELKAIKENVRRAGGYVYIGTGAILVIILIVILLL